MIEPIKRSLAGGIVLTGLVMSLLLANFQSAMAAEVETVPTASPGSEVEVSGRVDLVGARQEVELCWDAPRCDDLGSVQLDLIQSTYTTTVTIPEVGPGQYDIFACSSLGGCASATIEVVVKTATTTTTTRAPAQTTAPPTSTTQPEPTTTVANTTIGDTTATTVNDTTKAPVSGPASTADITSEEVEALTISATEDGQLPGPDESDQGPTTSTTVYQAPTTTYSKPASSSTTAVLERADAVIEIAGSDDDRGMSFDSPLVFWTVWLIVMIIAGGLVLSLWWLTKNRRLGD